MHYWPKYNLSGVEMQLETTGSVDAFGGPCGGRLVPIPNAPAARLRLQDGLRHLR